VRKRALSLRNTRPWPSADLVAAVLHPMARSPVRLQVADKTAVRLLGSMGWLRYCLCYIFLRSHFVSSCPIRSCLASEQLLARCVEQSRASASTSHCKTRSLDLVDYILPYQTSDETTITDTMASNQHFFPRAYISATITTAKSLTDHTFSSAA
jgi:hypothetical protein